METNLVSPRSTVDHSGVSTFLPPQSSLNMETEELGQKDKGRGTEREPCGETQRWES